MLERLPLAVLEDISLRAGQPTVLAQTCTGLWRAMHDPAVQLRLYMGMQRRATRHEASSASSCGSGSATLPSGRLGRISSDTVASSSSSDGADAESSGEPAAVCGPDTVFGLLVCKATTSDPHATLRLLQLLLACSNMVGLVPPHAQQALQQAIAATEPAAAPGALQLLQSVLPYAEHCLLPFAAGGGHLGLVRLLLRLTSTPVRLHGCLHYVRTSAFLAAASGGHAGVLSELLAAGAAHWACQLPGSSLTQTALDAAALGGHVPAMQLLAHYCRNPGPLFLTAAADSGSSDAMQFALEHWFAQANALTAYSRAHTLQLHEALRVSCQRGHAAGVRQLLAALHRTNSLDCSVLALTHASSSSSTDAMGAVLDSPQLAVQLSRGGLRVKLAGALAACARAAVMKPANAASLDLLLRALGDPHSAVAVARPLLAPHMPSVFDQAASAGNTVALQLLLLALPEHFEALRVSALEAALAEGQRDAAALVTTLLAMQVQGSGDERGGGAASGGGDGDSSSARPAVSASASCSSSGGAGAAGAAAGTAAASGVMAAASFLSAEDETRLARASLLGAYKSACASGDVTALQHLLSQGGALGPDDNVQLLLLRVAAGAGHEATVRLLLGAFGADGARQGAVLRAVCRGAVHAGRLALLQSLAADSPSPLLAHITSQPDALAEYLRAALLRGQVGVAAWLVGCAAGAPDLVRTTLTSLLATPRWELLDAGRGVRAQHVVLQLLRQLAPPTARSTSSSAAAPSKQAPASAAAEAAAGGRPPQRSRPAGAAAAAPAGDREEAAAAPAAAARADEGGPAGVSKLGAQLLQPQLLGLLLHAAQGSPWLLLEVCEVLRRWGLYHQPLTAAPQRSAEAGERAANTAVGGPSQGEGKAAGGGRAGASRAQRRGCGSAGTTPSSSSAGINRSQQTINSETLATDRVGSGLLRGVRVSQAAGDGSGMLLPSSLESGCSTPEGCTTAGGTWLGSLLHQGGGSTGVGGMAALMQPDRQLGLVGQPPQQHWLSAAGLLSPSTPHKHTATGALPSQHQHPAAVHAAAHGSAGGAAWEQQLSGGVARLRMSSSTDSSAPAGVEHHHQQQQEAGREPPPPQQQQQQQQQPSGGAAWQPPPRLRRPTHRHSVDLPHHHARRRDSSPVPRLRGASGAGASGGGAAAGPLRASASASRLPHSPVHPYMQHQAKRQQQQQQEQQETERRRATDQGSAARRQ